MCISNSGQVMGTLQRFSVVFTGGRGGMHTVQRRGPILVPFRSLVWGVYTPQTKQIDVRLQMDLRFSQRQYEKKKCVLAEKMEAFFFGGGGGTGKSIATATPRDV